MFPLLDLHALAGGAADRALARAAGRFARGTFGRWVLHSWWARRWPSANWNWQAPLGAAGRWSERPDRRIWVWCCRVQRFQILELIS